MTAIVQIIPTDYSAIGNEHLALAVAGFSVLFFTLLLLSLVFTVLPKLHDRKLRKKLQQEEGGKQLTLASTMLPGEVSAAIAMAISIYFEELHDQETAILTIKKVGKTYSPWNSKIYNVINFNRFQR